MLAPRNSLVSNLNYVHLQHVSLGVHLSLRPELMENSITRDPGKEAVTGRHHLLKDIADSVEVDANSNDPSVPCQCCDKHSEHSSPCLETSEDNLEANICEELLSPCDLPSSPLSPSSPSSNSSSSSDFTLDDSPVSMYYKEFLGDDLETPDHEPDIIPLDAAMESSLIHTQRSRETTNPTVLPPRTPEEPKTHSTIAATVPSTEWGEATDLDANCNEVSGLQRISSPATSGGVSSGEDSPQRTERDDKNANSIQNQEVTHIRWPLVKEDELLPGLALHGHVTTQSPKKNITSFNELAQKRRRSSGVSPSQQAKKDKSDWLIVFSPDSENPPVNELTATAFYQGAQEQYTLPSSTGKEVTTFRELKYRSTLSKQNTQPTKVQTIGDKGLQKPTFGENEFQHLAEREKWLETPQARENGSHHPREIGPQDHKEIRQTGEDVVGFSHHFSQEIRHLPADSRREHMDAADGRVHDSWSANRHMVPMSDAAIRSQRGATFNDSRGLGKKGGNYVPTPPKIWVRGMADGGDKKFREVEEHFMADGGQDSQRLDKKGLLVTIGLSVDNVICHFNSSRNQVKKAQLGDSKLSPELGYLLLNGLCPSLYKLLADGLKPFQKDVIIGSRRLGPWNLVETSTKQESAPGYTQRLFGTISRFSQLRDPQRRFNAFIFGLLNTKQLDIWMSHLHQTHSHYSTFYGSSAFLMLAASSRPELFDELLLILQPLSALNFHVDLLFEHHHLPLRDLSESDQLHSYGQMLSDPWGGRSLKHILHWGEQLAHNLVGNKDEVLSTHRETTQGLGLPLKNTFEENPTPSGDTPEEPTRNWWQHLSQASRIYIPSKKDSFNLTHLMKGISRGATESGKEEDAILHVRPESTQSRAQEDDSLIKEDGTDLTVQPKELPKPVKDREEKSSTGPADLDGGLRYSLEDKDMCTKPDARNEPLHQSNDDWGIWLGNLFGANPTQDRETEKRRVKSRRPSSWLTPNINVFGLIRKPSPPEKITSPAPATEDTSQHNTGKQERSVRALCDHSGTDREQLNFKKGDVLQLLSTVDEDWICCRHGIDTGLVPVGYTSLIL